LVDVDGVVNDVGTSHHVLDWMMN